MKRLVALFVPLLAVHGRALFTSPPRAPIVEDKVGERGATQADHRVGTLATVAQRRLALIKFADGKFCAEPPPDVVDNISSVLTTSTAPSNPATFSAHNRRCSIARAF